MDPTARGERRSVDRRRGDHAGRANELKSRRMKSVLVILALAATARAQMTDPPPRDNVQWQIELGLEHGWLGPDGRHLVLTWKRVPERTQGVLVLRRTLPADVTLDARPIRAVDHPGPLLVPTFLYPSSKKEYHPAFDTLGNPIPAGSRVGEWTVVAYIDSDPAQPIVDTVAADTNYVYALIPATPGPVPGSYKQLGDAIQTPSIAAERGWFYRLWWLWPALLVAVAGSVVLLRRSRARRGRVSSS